MSTKVAPCSSRTHRKCKELSSNGNAQQSLTFELKEPFVIETKERRCSASSLESIPIKLKELLEDGTTKRRCSASSEEYLTFDLEELLDDDKTNRRYSVSSLESLPFNFKELLEDDTTNRGRCSTLRVRDIHKSLNFELKESLEIDKTNRRWSSTKDFLNISSSSTTLTLRRSFLSKHGSCLSKSLFILFLISFTCMGKFFVKIRAVFFDVITHSCTIIEATGVYLGVHSYQNADDGSLSAIYHLKLSAKMQFPFNVTTSYFSHKNSKCDPNEIPLLLHDAEGRNNFGRKVLSDCFGLKGISLKEFNEEECYQNKPYSHDFYVSITSLCDFTHLNPSSNKFRVISYIQNPILSHSTQNNNAVLSSNPLTRSIVCKPSNEDKLKLNDVLTAKKFLKHICDVSMVTNYYEFIKNLSERYNWKSKDTNNDKKCELQFMERFRQLSHPINGDDLQQIVEKNSEDLSIYFDLIR